MAPLKKAPRAAERDRGRTVAGNEIYAAQQAGRSVSSLGVERDTAGFTRKARTGTSDYPPQTPTPQSRARQPPLTEPNSASALPPLQMKSSFVPPVPSPLNNSSSATSISSVDTGDNALNFGTPRASTSQELPRQNNYGNLQTKHVPGRTNAVDLNPVQQQQRSSSPSATPLTPLAPSAPRAETPKSLSELGRDYSRYPESSTNLSLMNVNSRRHSAGPIYALGGSASTVSFGTNTDQNPFLDSNATGEAEKQWYPDDSLGGLYFGAEKGFMLYPEDIEDDDEYHMPQPSDYGKDRPKFSDFFKRKNIVNSLGAAFLILGLFCVFILIPVLTYTGVVKAALPGQDTGGSTGQGKGPAWAHVNDVVYENVKNSRTTLIDPDTPQSAMTRTSTFDGSELQLVFSDEFNQNNRSFYPGDDPFWTAPDIWYGATQDLEW